MQEEQVAGDYSSVMGEVTIFDDFTMWNTPQEMKFTLDRPELDPIPVHFTFGSLETPQANEPIKVIRSYLPQFDSHIAFREICFG